MLLKGLFQLEHSQDFSNFQLKFHCYKLNVSYMIIIYETLHVKIVKWIGIQLQKKKKGIFLHLNSAFLKICNLIS